MDLTEYIVDNPLYDINVKDINPDELGKIIEGRREDMVYILYNKNNNLYKIGYSTDFRSRFMKLENDGGNTLEVIFLAQIEPGISPSLDYIEGMLKKYFHKKKVKGEWFRLNARDLVQIRTYFRYESLWMFWDYKEFDMDIIRLQPLQYAKKHNI